jgi:hypothetical protein
MARNIRQLANYRPHTIVRELAEIAKADPRTYEQLMAIDGITRQSFYSWVQGKTVPRIGSLSVRAATLGYKIVIVPDTQP